MNNSFVTYLQSKGFTYISFDLTQGATITAWRKTEKKTYSVYRAADLAEAESKMLALIDTPVAVPEPDFDDI